MLQNTVLLRVVITHNHTITILIILSSKILGIHQRPCAIELTYYQINFLSRLIEVSGKKLSDIKSRNNQR